MSSSRTDDTDPVPDESGERDPATAGRDASHPLGRQGASFDRESPFYRGLSGALGVAVVALLAWLVIQVSAELILIGLALFIAVGLEPAVVWLGRWMRRWVSVTVVVVAGLGVVAAFLATAIPVVVSQATQAATAIPQYLASEPGRNSLVGQLASRLQVQQVLEQILSGGGGSVVLGAGEAILTGLTSTIILIALVIYFLADLPRLRRTLYRLSPRSRRSRVSLIGDEIFAKVGGYVLGSLTLALIAGVTTLIVLEIVGTPYAVLLAILVALLDLIPVFGTVVGGVVVTLVTLTVSVPAAIIVAVFFVVYRVVEDYVLLPKIVGRTVDVPALVTLVSVVLGAALLGPVGAIIAIPLAAALLLLLRELAFPSLERR